MATVKLLLHDDRTLINGPYSKFAVNAHIILHYARVYDCTV